MSDGGVVEFDPGHPGPEDARRVDSGVCQYPDCESAADFEVTLEGVEFLTCDDCSEENLLDAAALVDDERPFWEAAGYDPDASVRERIRAMPDLGSVEVQAHDPPHHKWVLGSPHEIRERGNGVVILRCGGSPYNWNYEVVVTADDEVHLRKVGMESEMPEHAYLSRDVAVRLYGIDLDRIDGVDNKGTTEDA